MESVCESLDVVNVEDLLEPLKPPRAMICFGHRLTISTAAKQAPVPFDENQAGRWLWRCRLRGGGCLIRHDGKAGGMHPLQSPSDQPQAPEPIVDERCRPVHE